MQLISVKTIILKIIRDLGLGNKEIPAQDLVEWCAEGLQHIGAYGQYIEKEEELTISDYTAKLPCDYYRAVPQSLPHKVVGDTLRVGQRHCKVKFKYLAIPLDEEGYPLVPDNISYATALFWKCAMQLAIRDELPNKNLTFPICKQRWDWYCRQAGSSSMFNHQTMATYATGWLAQIPALTQADLDFPLLDTIHGS